MLRAVSLAIALALAASAALAQSVQSVAGSYTLVKNDVFGDKPRGTLLLGADGRYALIIARASLPRIAGNVRDQASAEENKAVVSGSIAHWGRYTVDDGGKSLTFHIETSTFPNWDGQTQKRQFTASGDTLTYVVAAPTIGGGPNELVWRKNK